MVASLEDIVIAHGLSLKHNKREEDVKNPVYGFS